jgi:hypothetical protein
VQSLPELALLVDEMLTAFDCLLLAVIRLEAGSMRQDSHKARNDEGTHEGLPRIIAASCAAPVLGFRFSVVTKKDGRGGC